MAYKNPPKETQFKPGQSGNLKGKPPGTLSVKTVIRKWLEQEVQEENQFTKTLEKMSVADVLVLRQIAKAKKGDTRAFEVLKDHIEAKPKQEIDLTSAGEKINQKEIIFRDYSEKK